MRSHARPGLALALAAMACGACGGAQTHRDLSYGDNAAATYEAALSDVRAGNCTAAEPVLRRIRREFAYSRYAPLAELRIADCLMVEKKFPEAISAYRTFIRTRPLHDDVPYASFKVAECYFKQIPGESFLQPPAEERDQSSTHQALTQLHRFMLDYPDDPRVGEASRMETEALTLLARHEFYVATYYLEHDHPDAAVARLRQLLTAYRGSSIEPQAMLLLGRVYLRMQKRDEALAAFHMLVERHPQSGYAAQARGYLHDLGGA